MNLLSILLPKAEVAYLEGAVSVRQAVEKMCHYHYTAVPVLDSQGHYLYTISSGDLLCYLQEHELALRDMETGPLENVPIFRPIKAMSILASTQEVGEALRGQNFVPIVDDKGVFIGIITRYRYIAVVSDKKND